MPVHPSEENAPEGITEKVAKNPSSNTESTASDHSTRTPDPGIPTYLLNSSAAYTFLDINEHTPEKANAQDFQSKGPVIPQTMDDMPPKASKEELKARAKELNQ